MATAPLPSESVSHYRLVELLGQGAMGEVWLAEDTHLPRKVAVKLLPRHLAQDREAVERLLREAQAAASVDHPGVVSVYEAGMAGGRPYLVMQRVEGQTLEERLASGPLEVAEALAVATRIADALAEVHALGIVHRDLKPSNVLLTARGPKVLDFGVASVRGSPRLTATGAAVGTPQSMSPEQVRGLPCDNRADLWALGVILYRMLTGRPPFAGESWEAAAHQVLHAQPVAPSTLRAEVQPELDYIVMKLLRKDPAKRYARAEDLIADLASCAGGDQAGEDREPAAPRLAVLYFELLSAEPDDAFLAAGLTEDLIVDLTRVGGLRVASRAEVAPYRERSVPPRTLARELAADYVLMGSVRHAGNRARISAQLVRAADGNTLWADRFDRTLEDLFDVQAEVSKRIVEALQVALRPGEREMLDRAPARNTEAYALYLQARDLIDRTVETNRRGEELLQRAIALDDRFALAHAALGETYAMRGNRWWASPAEAAALAVPHARRALELEPDLVEAHLVLAMVQRLRGDPSKALEAVDHILALDPDHPDALEWAGWSFLSIGQPERAVGLLERGAALHPERYLLASFLDDCYQLLGRQADAQRVRRHGLERTLEMLRRKPGPESAHARTLVGISLVREGRSEEGLAQIEQAVRLQPDDGRLHYNAACAYALAGRPERALGELREGTRNIPGYIGDWPLYDPDLASLRDHPDFIRMFGRPAKRG